MLCLFNFVYFRMHVPMFLFMLMSLMTANGFTVKGPSGPLVVPLGGSVLLPCSVDSLVSLEGLEVEWRRSDSQTLIHLYQDGDVRPEAQHQDYHDRAHFITEDIKHGNFSLLLENVRAEDEGQYTCKVFTRQDDGETVVQVKCEDVERLIVSGSDRSVSAYVGADVTLNCSVDSHIPPDEIEEVSWKKTYKDENILVLFYENNQAHPDSSNERYRDRVEFFTDEIHRGNFSLRLKSVRTEDKGLYMCQVFAGGLSANTTVKLEQLGFSASHIIVLILCVAACGSAVLICCLIYCRPNNKDSALRLQLLLAFCPNIIMFFSFILWSVSEGSVNETVCCCTLYILRPLMLIWAAPYIDDFRDRIKTQILKCSHVAEYFVLTPVVYSALLTNTWQKLLNYAEFERVWIIILYVIMFLCCLGKSIYILAAQIGNRSGLKIKILDIVADILPILQFLVLFYTFGSAREDLIIIAVVLLVLLFLKFFLFLFRKCSRHFSWSSSIIRTVWLIVTLVLNAVMIGLYVFTLENETDPVGWACVMVFLQILWTLVRFTDQSVVSVSSDFNRFDTVYVFGSVVVVLISAAALMTELILKTVNGERSVMDLRFIVFPSECFFILSVMISGQFASKIKECLKSCQKQTSDNRPQQDENQHSPRAAGSDEPPATGSNHNTRESQELNPLMETEDHQTVQIQPDSVISQP